MRNFDKIYDNKLWGDEGNGSGTGSMMHTTVSIRSLIEDLIENHGVNTIVDVSVGGMTWWPTVLEKFPAVKFFGYDISLTKTQENKKRFAANKNWKFYFGDLVSKKDYPQCDLLICRHTLNHLTSEDVIKCLGNLQKVQHKFLGITQHPTNELEKEITILTNTPGCIEYRPINLLLPPISLPQPWKEIMDADAEDIQINWERKFSLWIR